MKLNNRNWMLMLFAYVYAVILLANQALAASGQKARQLSPPLASNLAEKWRASGEYFTWQSPRGRNVKIFYARSGDTAKPAILMLHGFPTDSFDFHLLIEELQPDFRICTFDFPGYGLSHKPAAGYRYTLREDAEITRYGDGPERKWLAVSRGGAESARQFSAGRKGSTAPFSTLS